MSKIRKQIYYPLVFFIFFFQIGNVIATAEKNSVFYINNQRVQIPLFETKIKVDSNVKSKREAIYEAQNIVRPFSDTYAIKRAIGYRLILMTDAARRIGSYLYYQCWWCYRYEIMCLGVLIGLFFLAWSPVLTILAILIHYTMIWTGLNAIISTWGNDFLLAIGATPTDASTLSSAFPFIFEGLLFSSLIMIRILRRRRLRRRAAIASQ